MEKIPDASQIKAWDAETIRSQGISSIDLMERAAQAFVSEYLKLGIRDTAQILVVCGTGNNGGDGLAIARILSLQGRPVQVLVVGDTAKGSLDFCENLERLPLHIPILLISIDDVLPTDFVRNSDVIIDSLFGSGLNRSLDGGLRNIVEVLNALQSFVVAVDVPSGMHVDEPTRGAVVHADVTITFQSPKLAFMLPDNIDHVGRLVVADIGLDQHFQTNLESRFSLIGTEDFPVFLSKRRKSAHKGNFGNALLMAGSHGMIGAAVLCSRAALRAGCGKVTAHIPGCGYQILQTAVPEALVQSDKNLDEISSLVHLEPFNVIGAGPGLGTGAGASRVIRALLESAVCPLVLDADALNILSQHTGLLALIPKGTILTPHPGEFRRLAGEWKDDGHRLRLLQQFAASLNCIVILKGAHTTVAFPDGSAAFNLTGNPFMATAGSGDVLTGILVSLLAQGCTPEQAAISGVLLHGLAGDLAALASDGSCAPIMAGDLVDRIPEAFRQLSLSYKGKKPRF